MRLRYLYLPDLPPLSDATITFGHEPVLGRDCTIHFIAGINGTGKSRLLRALAEIFLYLEQGEVPPFAVDLAYDLGRGRPGQTTSQAQRTIYYHCSGDHSKANAYMVELAPIPLHDHDKVEWDEFASFDWRHGPQEDLPYHRRNCFYSDGTEDTYSMVQSYLPSVVLAYTSGSAHDWEMTFQPPSQDLEDTLDTRFPNVPSEIEERRSAERPAHWNQRKEAKYWRQLQDDTTTSLRSAESRAQTKETTSGGSIGIFVRPETLKLVVCAVALSQVLTEFHEHKTAAEREAFKQEIDHAIEEHRHMEGLRDLLNAVDWLWPITIGLRIDFRPKDFLDDETKLLSGLYSIATKVIRDSDPSSSRTFFFDLQRTLSQGDNTLYALTNTLSGGSNIIENDKLRTSAFAIFKQLLLLQQRGILEDVTIVLKKRQVKGALLYDWLSDGERMFLGRMALFHLLQGFDDTLIILDEPETHFNDVWKREIVDIIDNGLRNNTSEIVISTHSSLALTDVFDSEIVLLKKNPEDATVYATQPAIKTFGASPSDILRDIFGAPDSIGRRASEFLDLILVLATSQEQTQQVWDMEDNMKDNDERIRTSDEFQALKNFISQEPNVYAIAKSAGDFEDYLIRVLHAIYTYTQQIRDSVNIVNTLDILQPRLGPGYYQYEFRSRLRALLRESHDRYNI